MITADQQIDQKARKARYFQLIAIVIISLLFALLSKPLHIVAVIYGGAVSLLLSWTLSWSMRKANEIARTDPKKGMAVLYMGAVVRFVLLLVLLAIGIGTLGLNPIPVVLTVIVVWLLGVIVPQFVKATKKK